MKNKILNCDFLVVGAGLIGSLTAITLIKKKFKVVIVDKNNFQLSDQRTLAVNANSRAFLHDLGLWKKLEKKSEAIKKIIIKDSINIEQLDFENGYEPMGSVIFNKDLLKISHIELNKTKSLFKNISLSLAQLSVDQPINIQNQLYKFKKIILTVGKKFIENDEIKKISFNTQHQSYVGFFDHKNYHQNIAYEYFTDLGPLAVLPAPSKDKKLSTFILSTKNNYNYKQLNGLLKKYFNKTHGNFKLHNKILKFPLSPHLSETIKNNFFLIGDTLRSIHPVAGQGWNLGIKDIQDLCSIIDSYSLDFEGLEQIYYSRRGVENSVYISFTSVLNFLYDHPEGVNKKIIKLGFRSLLKFNFLRKLFIKQAMGTLKLI